MFKTALIISVYNRMDYLKLVLAGFENQTEKNFEVVIADDGSNKEFVDELDKIALNYSFSISHVWHEDKGFRKNKILNEAIASTQSNYLIFIDGDCIPHSHFVEEHIKYASKGICLTGRRVNLSEKITLSLTEDKVKNGWLEKNFYKVVKDGLLGESNYVEKGFYFKSNFFRRAFNKKQRGLLGCNFSLFKDDMLLINGFDERYQEPSIGEDTDVQFRLELKGLKIKSLNHIAVQYHLYHQLQERKKTNIELFDQVRKNKIAYTPFGINK
ncbi:glycosyltransferase [Melioribacteraceae bacterium 4301-Me]|uniref:glycosyltransferase n=1 Tax=Pyranulibacter aquaticus TaxID=3163344 RepID=UPI003599C863